MRKSVKRALGAGVVGGAAYAAWRAWNARGPKTSSSLEWSTAPFPFPPMPRPSAPAPAPQPHAASAPATETAPTPAWVEPNRDGSCPSSHPIKAKLTSGIYHVPGGANYARTKPDRCYRDESAAAADGLRPSKV